MTLYEKALLLALRAHQHQVRKHDSSPYIVHPIMVARIVEQSGYDEAAVAAALLHDVLEDTSITAEEISTLLGEPVLRIVTAVTEDKVLEWEERKINYIKNVVSAHEAVHAVAVADKIHNARNLIAFHEQVGKHAWEVFNRGKDKKIWFEKTFNEELRAVFNHPLLDEHDRLIQQMEKLDA